MPARISGGWSEGIQGPDSSQFEFNRQLVVGLALVSLRLCHWRGSLARAMIQKRERFGDRLTLNQPGDFPRLEGGDPDKF